MQRRTTRTGGEDHGREHSSSVNTQGDWHSQTLSSAGDGCGLWFKCNLEALPVGSFVTLHSVSFRTGNVAARILALGTLPASYREASRLCEIRRGFARPQGGASTSVN